MATQPQVVQTPQGPVEQIIFTRAEAKMLQEKRQKLAEAQADAQAFVDFLTSQHGITDQRGWQLGDIGFARKVEAQAAPAPEAAAEAKPARPKRAAKPKAAAEPIPVKAAAGDNPVVEEKALAAQNGHVDSDPASL